ncbi:hypothetical protein BGZ54_005956 [Gamsiella multidivaricata]|nr:hypothetical protein BGZ54_005956 [Gamsiella multidivaricata]
MKESSDRDAENLISVEEQEYQNNNGGTPNNRSNTSLNKNLPVGQSQQQHQQQGGNGDAGSYQNGKFNSSNANGAVPEKRSRLDRIFGKKTSANSHAPSSLRNHQVTPHPQPQTSRSRPQSQTHSQHTPSPSLRPSNTLAVHPNPSRAHSNTSAADLADLSYLPAEEESEEEVVVDRSMGAGVDGPNGEPTTGTEVKLHPTRAKTFALPKSLRNLKRRIAALRAKGTDLDAEKKEKEERERAANGGAGTGDEKKKFTFIRLLPWRSTKKLTEPTRPAEAGPVAA